MKFMMHYVQELITDTVTVKFGIAAAVAVLESLVGVTGVLFWLTLFMWILDFVLGFFHAASDPKIVLKFSRILDTVFKLPVIILGLLTMDLLEQAIEIISGASIPHIFDSAFLAIIFVGEATSTLRHVVYFFPAVEPLARRALGAITPKEEKKDE